MVKDENIFVEPVEVLQEGRDYVYLGDIKVDPKDLDPIYQNIMSVVGAEINKKYEKTKDEVGFCITFWEEKKEILRQKYGISWKTPMELNPTVLFD